VLPAAAVDGAAVWYTHAPVSERQSLTTPRSPAVAKKTEAGLARPPDAAAASGGSTPGKRAPSGSVTSPSSASNVGTVATLAPVRMSQTMATLSRLAVTRCQPSGDSDSAVTAEKWPL
jgi:hypothetical protein